jgi:chorismate mutase
MDISSLRKYIDEIDDQIIRLINKRFDIVGIVKDYKNKKYGDEFLYLNEEREVAILKRVCSKFADLNLDPSMAYGIWRNIISAANRFEQKDLTICYSSSISNRALQIIQKEYPNTLIHRNYNDIKEINISSNTIICIEFDCVDNRNSDDLEVDNSFSCYRKIKSHDSKNLYVGFFGKIIK